MVGGAVAPLLITNASADPRFREHPGLHLYGIESYIAVPLNRLDGSYFGTLCAMDPLPAELSTEDFAIFKLLAQLIAFELEADEQQQRREAALRAMEDFVEVAVHDLRQPLAALYGRAQLLTRRAQRGASAEELALGAGQVAAHARRASLLSETLLDVARIDTGTFRLSLRPVDIVSLLDQAIEDVQITAPNHLFQFEAPPILPWQADEPRIGQLFRNLLDNAAKYAPASSGPVQVTAAIVPGEPQALVVRVRDSGVGVEDALLPRLFERMYRAVNGDGHMAQGAGMGLYIARTIVEAHGGTLWAEQTPGGGLTVCLRLQALSAVLR